MKAGFFNSLAMGVTMALGLASQAGAAPVFVYDKIGATASQADVDLQRCTQKASRISLSGGTIVAATVWSGVIGGVAEGAIAGVRRAHQIDAAKGECMIQHGYAKLALTPEETAAYEHAGSKEAKRAWLAEFIGKDWSERIATAQAAQPRLLPQLDDEPFAVLGVRFDVAKLTTAQGRVGSYKPLLTGEVTHRETATLDADVQAKGVATETMKAGEVLYAVDASGSESPEQTTLWCGPRTATSFMGKHDGVACLLSTPAGDAILPVLGTDWMMSPDLILKQLRPMPLTSGPVAMTVSDTDRIGPMSFTLEALNIENDRVRLRATAERGGRKEPIWTGDVRFDASGRAILPFWSKLLVLTRYYDKGDDRNLVEVSLQDGGTGAGWLDPAGAATVAQAGVAAQAATP